jgi:hypothetical protein
MIARYQPACAFIDQDTNLTFMHRYPTLIYGFVKMGELIPKVLHRILLARQVWASPIDMVTDE